MTENETPIIVGMECGSTPGSKLGLKTGSSMKSPRKRLELLFGPIFGSNVVTLIEQISRTGFGITPVSKTGYKV